LTRLSSKWSRDHCLLEVKNVHSSSMAHSANVYYRKQTNTATESKEKISMTDLK